MPYMSTSNEHEQRLRAKLLIFSNYLIFIVIWIIGLGLMIAPLKWGDTTLTKILAEFGIFFSASITSHLIYGRFIRKLEEDFFLNKYLNSIGKLKVHINQSIESEDQAEHEF